MTNKRSWWLPFNPDRDKHFWSERFFQSTLSDRQLWSSKVTNVSKTCASRVSSRFSVFGVEIYFWVSVTDSRLHSGKQNKTNKKNPGKSLSRPLFFLVPFQHVCSKTNTAGTATSASGEKGHYSEMRARFYHCAFHFYHFCLPCCGEYIYLPPLHSSIPIIVSLSLSPMSSSSSSSSVTVGLHWLWWLFYAGWA